MIMECRTVSGIENWLLVGGWRENGNIHSRFCKIILGVTSFSASSLVVLELGRIVGEQNFRPPLQDTD
jgi:hypothetical protein